MHYLTRTIDAAGEYISASRVNTYISCPRKYWFNYVAKAEKESHPAALMFGTAAHDVIAHVYELIKSSKLHTIPQNNPLKDLTNNAFDEALNEAHKLSDKIKYPPKPGMANADEMRRKLHNVLQTWWDKTELPEEVLATETSFRAEITDPRTGELRDTQLLGIVDAVTRRENETILEEHKTSARKWTAADSTESLQSTLYLAAHRQITTMRFNILIKTKIPNLQTTTTTRTALEKKDGVLTLCSVMDAINAGIFYPIKSWMCSGCPFLQQCKAGHGV